MHIPVLEQEMIELLDPHRGDNFIDCTFGEGGHAEKILAKTAFSKTDLSQGGLLIGIEWDQGLIKLARKRFRKYGNRVLLVNDNYAHIREIVNRLGFSSLTIKGIYFDLGVCLWHYKKSQRGFSFQREEPLDMRFNEKQQLKASDIVNQWRAEDIEIMLRDYGEIKEVKKLSKAILRRRRERRFVTTNDLITVVRQSMPNHLKNGQKTIRKVFQALRIATNHELENLRIALSASEELLMPQGKIAVISYHSLEDRIVKQFFEHNSNLEVLTPKPVEPSRLEVRFNPSSRSAKLRVALKTKSN